MRFLKKKVFSKMALMPMHYESSEEEEETIKDSVQAKPEVQPLPKPDIIEPKKICPKIAPKETSNRFLKDELPIEPPSFMISFDKMESAETNNNTKNIVKNYGKAMCSFAASNLSLVYAEPLAIKEGIKIDRFREYFRCKKELVGSIESFRNLYIEDETDKEEIKAFKRIFKEVSIVFMKYFSVNWIFNGKLTQKQAHLKYRFKILRRIMHPELFTYLKS